MSKRDQLWRRACSWVRGWQGGKSTPSPQMAYIAGYQACARDSRKAKNDNLRIKMAMPFGFTQEFGWVSLPSYSAATAAEVGEKIMERARREGFKGALHERLVELHWVIVEGEFLAPRIGK